MFSSVDKAIVALIMAVIFLLNHYFAANIGISPEQVQVWVAVLTPILVYLIPNKQKQ